MAHALHLSRDMNIAIVRAEQTGGTKCYELACDGTTMVFAVARTHVTMLVPNASHRAWRGGGKTFHGADRFDQATAAYKSPACKAMIDMVRREVEGAS